MKTNFNIEENLNRWGNLSFDSDLPIISKKDEIIEYIKKEQVLIISGETGSGKTTQIPKLCLLAGRGLKGMIGCTQPRRIAAISIAKRISEEIGEENNIVGYKIRFQDTLNKNNIIKIMTDGILLTEAQKNPYLTYYDTIIVDEAHERSLNIDFILGLLRKIITKRKNLKVIITSATIDTEKFSRAFNNAKIIEVSGRLYPVDLNYVPIEFKQNEDYEPSYVESAVDATIKLIESYTLGDILIFMPTEQDIRETCELIAARRYSNILILPLYARLSSGEQSRIFLKTFDRKIIVATNIAETSITIPGIKYVIDTGVARVSQYNPNSRTTSLPISSVSQSSLNQRKGRCGRIENGVCIRLFSEEDFNSRSVYTPPEILRSNLAEVILKMMSLNLGNIYDFPFIDAPLKRNIKDGFDLLFELGAISYKNPNDAFKSRKNLMLTKKGWLMSRLPVDPRISSMLIEAKKNGCLKDILIIASALASQDVRERPLEKAKEADKKHAVFNDPMSDFTAFINIWNWYHTKVSELPSKNALKKLCLEHFLSFRKIKEWIDIHEQLVSILEESDIEIEEQENPKKNNFKLKDFSPLYMAIHCSILSGYLSNIAMQKEKNIFKAAKGKEAMIFPGSVLFGAPPEWIVAFEFVETSRLFARTNAKIHSSWLESIGKDLCRYSYIEPAWSKKRGEVIATEQVILFGLIIDSRTVSYGRTNPEEATEIFIQNALIDLEVIEILGFMKYNLLEVESVRVIENKLRRRDILVSDEKLFDFYKERLKIVYDFKTLKYIIKKKGSDDFLKFSRDMLINFDIDEEKLSLYPDTLYFGTRGFKCEYHFDPSDEKDGITIKVPLDSVPFIKHERLDWLIPAYLHEKIEALIKVLPKSYRKIFVPILKTVDIILNEMPKNEESLFYTLSTFISNRFGVEIPSVLWKDDAISPYLKMRISILGPDGQVLESSRNKSILFKTIKLNNEKEFDEAKKGWEKENCIDWIFGTIPEAIKLESNVGLTWTVFPGLEKGNKCVNLRLFESPYKALTSHIEGVQALYSIKYSLELKFLKKIMVLSGEHRKIANYFGGIEFFEKQLCNRIIKDIFCRNIKDENEFISYGESAKKVIIEKGRDLLEKIKSFFKTYDELRTYLYDLKISLKNSSVLDGFIEELRTELDNLVPADFLNIYPSEKLIDIERYIKGIYFRAKRGMINYQKDQAKYLEVRDFIFKYEELVRKVNFLCSKEKQDALFEFFWMLQEYRISIFAQELKTSFPVSKKKLENRLKEIEMIK
ncbi:MAG: ATP-dependent RNA helicase HrpA [Desulfobacterales bacterium]|nr:ATP-dependent RNA helicase HrpA [Desulfobacterales bacterium]